MEFWGFELDRCEKFSIPLEGAYRLELTHFSIGEPKSGIEEPDSVVVTLCNQGGVRELKLDTKRGRQKHVRGTYIYDDFEISHNYRNGSVFCFGIIHKKHGYKPYKDNDDYEEEETPEKVSFAIFN